MYLNYETLYFMCILPKEVSPQGVLELQIPLGLRLPSFHFFPHKFKYEEIIVTNLIPLGKRSGKKLH